MENQTPVLQEVTPQVVLEQPKQSNFLIILLSIISIISLSIAGFFAFQNQKLVKELKLLRIQPNPVTEATILPTIEPTISISTTPPPTLHWKFYTNTSSNYQIKYPSDWKVINQSAGSMGLVGPDARYIEIGIGEGKSGTLGIEEQQIIPPSEEINLTTTKAIGNLTMRCNGDFTTEARAWCWIKVPNQDKYLNIQFFKNSNAEMNIILEQILSTFKFTN
jgi:hypothetical protein